MNLKSKVKALLLGAMMLTPVCHVGAMGSENGDQTSRDNQLFLAVYDNQEIKVKQLLEDGADPNYACNPISTILNTAACTGNLKVFKVLLDHGMRVKDVNIFKETALHSAATYGHVDMVALLLERGVDPKAVDRFGHTALQLAAIYGHVDVVKLLLERGVDWKAVDRYGRTALQNAYLNRHYDVVVVLEDRLLGHSR